MKDLKDNSIDMVLADLPYGTTACKWDIVIPMEPLWKEYNRVAKDNAAMVFFGSQPFTANLIVSNLENFKYEWIWKKNAGSNFAQVKYQPMKDHENILVFSKGRTKYNPILQERAESAKQRVKYPILSNTTNSEFCSIKKSTSKARMCSEKRVPSSVQFFNRERGFHPTQKPVNLLEYLIKTYTSEGDTVMDNVMGSGSTGVACKNLNRKFIGIEKEEKYFKIAEQRINEPSQISLIKSV